MRPRFGSTALLAAFLLLFPAAALASASGFAQAEQPPDTEAPVEEEDPVGEERENGAGAEDEEGAEGPVEEEEGPPWTYQMARLSLAALVLLGAAVGAAYYRFVILRRRGYV
jgi:hypothetical protein